MGFSPNQRRNGAQQTGDDRPILFVDVDGVISLFGFDPEGEAPGTYHTVDGILHCIGHACADRLARLRERFELVWASGWEERANEHMPFLLQMDIKLATLTFDGRARFGSAHWKVGAIDQYAGDRAAAWIDDFLDDTCIIWAKQRKAPTLLIRTDSARGIEEWHVERLLAWADAVERAKSNPDPTQPSQS